MEYSKLSLGQFLKQQREAKGLSIDEVALETNIAKKYVEALEKDEYGFFPAEMYVTGFLSSYIEILEVDRELVLSMYRRAVNKEKEVPLEEFYNISYSSDNKKKYLQWFVIAIPIFLIIGIVLVLFSNSKNTVSSRTTRNGALNIQTFGDLVIDVKTFSESNQFEVGINSIIQLTDENKELAQIEFLGTSDDNKLIKFRIGQNRYTYKIGDVLNIDVTGNGNDDLSLEIISINSESVLLGFTFQYVERIASFFDITPYVKSIRNELPLADVGNTTTFNAKITATRPVWVGYQVDTTEEQQKILNPGDTVEFSFVDGAKVSLGNAGAATITFSEFTNVIRGGSSGESSQSIFYKKRNGKETKLYRAQLK